MLTTTWAKGDQDPATWLPGGTYQCTYMQRWVDIKSKYQLTTDQAEHDALDSALGPCP